MSGWQNEPFVIELKAGDKKALCMCGKSKVGPYCDGSHQGTGITPQLVSADEDKTIYACGCQQSANRPFCDGTHTKLAEENDQTAETEKRWYKVAELGELKDGEVAPVQAGTTTVALTYVDGKFGAIDGHCPHQGGPLAEGSLDDKGCLQCPWHGWTFDPVTGKSEYGDEVPCYEVEQRDDGIYVEVEEQVDHTVTVSDVMAETMVNWGVKHVFGMVGHSNLGLAEALRKQEEKGNLSFIGIRHEGAAAFAASGYAKASGIPAACLTIAGPGATNLLTGLWDAKVDRAPVLALTGQVNTQVLGPGAFQEVDLKAAFDAVSCWSQTVLHSSDYAELMSLALKNALVHRDVSHLIFPDEVQVLSADENKPANPDGRLGDKNIAPSAASLQAAIDEIKGAKKPAIIVGYGARDAMPGIIKLAESLNCPVITTFKAKGQISDHHPLATGVLGRSGTPISANRMSEARSAVGVRCIICQPYWY